MTESLKKTVQKHTRKAAPRRSVTQDAEELYTALRLEFREIQSPDGLTWHVVAPSGRPIQIFMYQMSNRGSHDGSMLSFFINVRDRQVENQRGRLNGWEGPEDPRQFARAFRKEVEKLLDSRDAVLLRLRDVLEPLGWEVDKTGSSFYAELQRPLRGRINFNHDGSFGSYNQSIGAGNNHDFERSLKAISAALVALKALQNAGFEIDLSRELAIAGDYLQELL